MAVAVSPFFRPDINFGVSDVIMMHYVRNIEIKFSDNHLNGLKVTAFIPNPRWRMPSSCGKESRFDGHFVIIGRPFLSSYIASHSHSNCLDILHRFIKNTRNIEMQSKCWVWRYHSHSTHILGDLFSPLISHSFSST